MTKISNDLKQSMYGSGLSPATWGWNELTCGIMLFQMVLSTGLNIIGTAKKVQHAKSLPDKQKPAEVINFSRLATSSNIITH